MTVRISYNLFTQHAKGELADFTKWTQENQYRQGDDMFRLNGAGEMLTFSAADFEDFLQPRPDLPPSLEGELTDVARLLAEKRWPFRLHATYDESISRFLNVFENVNRQVPFKGLRWFFDHAETVSEKNLDRIQALGGGIAVQHRMAFQGEYFIERYGRDAVRHSPPIRSMLNRGIPVGAGTDGTRVASYNPFVSLYWLISGKTVGGTPMYGEENRMDRTGALKLYTAGSAWLSGDDQIKGSIKIGQLADFAVLTADFFTIPEDQIKSLESVLTAVGGKIVYAVDEFTSHGPPSLPVIPNWAPVAYYGGYQNVPIAAHRHTNPAGCSHTNSKPASSGATRGFPSPGGFWGAGCSCWAF